MAKISKREKENKSKVEAQKFYALNEAVELVKALANAKFNESVDIAVQLGIDPRKSDQAVRGSVVMPAGTGKTVRVAVFAQGAAAEAAKEAGADIVGMEDLAHEIKGGKMDFDVVIAEPAAMRVVGQLGQIPLPTDKEVITILRAVHKYKDSREQFEMRTHKRLIDVLRPTKETTAALENLELPAGVNIVMEIK